MELVLLFILGVILLGLLSTLYAGAKEFKKILSLVERANDLTQEALDQCDYWETRHNEAIKQIERTL